MQEPPQAPVGAAPQTAGGAQSLGVGDQVRREGQRDDYGYARLVQRARQRLQQPRRVGEGVRRAYADEERGQFQAVVQREDQALRGDPAADPDALGPVGEGDFGEGDDDVRAGDGGAEDYGEGEADAEDGYAQLDEGAVGTGPGPRSYVPPLRIRLRR